MEKYKVTYLDLFNGKVKIKYYATAWQMQELYMNDKIEIIDWIRTQTKLKEGNIKLLNNNDLSPHSPILTLPCFGSFGHEEGHLKYKYRKMKNPF